MIFGWSFLSLLTGFVESLLASLIQVLVCLFFARWVPVFSTGLPGTRRPLPNLQRTSRGAKEVKDGGVFLADWRLKKSGKEENVNSWCGWYIYIEVLLLKYCKFTISKTDQEKVVKMRIAARGLIRRDPSDPSSEHLFHVHRAMREQLPALTSHVWPHLFLRGLPHSAEPIITRVSYLCRLEKSCVFRLFNWLQGIFMFLQ